MSEQVRAKFSVQTVERQGYPVKNNADGIYDETAPAQPKTTGVKVNLAPVYCPKDTQSENGKFWEATPQGQLWMQINNPAAFDFFKEGAEYYLTFEKA
jgi:hypothetical protein